MDPGRAAPPLISIVVPCFNQADYLEACVESCLKQTYPRLEIVLVDDGSTDTTAVKTAELARRDARVKAYSTGANLGAPAARNLGLGKSSGEVVYFLDADDFIYAEASLAELMARFPETADFVFGDRVVLNEVTRARHRVSQDPHHFGDPLLDLLRKHIATGTMLVRRHFFDRASWDPADKRLQDYNLFVTGVIEGMRYAYAPVPVVVVREHGASSRISNVSPEKYLEIKTGLFFAFEDRLRGKGRFDAKTNAFFSYSYCAAAVMLLREEPEKSAPLARAAWKRVDRLSAARHKDFRPFSWNGVALLTGPFAAYRLWWWRDRLLRRNKNA